MASIYHLNQGWDFCRLFEVDKKKNFVDNFCVDKNIIFVDNFCVDRNIIFVDRFFVDKNEIFVDKKKIFVDKFLSTNKKFPNKQITNFLSTKKKFLSTNFGIFFYFHLLFLFNHSYGILRCLYQVLNKFSSFTFFKNWFFNNNIKNENKK